MTAGRLHSLGQRIDAAMKHHGFTEHEMIARKIKWLMAGKTAFFTPREARISTEVLLSYMEPVSAWQARAADGFASGNPYQEKV